MILCDGKQILKFTAPKADIMFKSKRKFYCIKRGGGVEKKGSWIQGSKHFAGLDDNDGDDDDDNCNVLSSSQRTSNRVGTRWLENYDNDDDNDDDDDDDVDDDDENH